MSQLRPARALLHPVWWIALALLITNDHLLKGSGLLPAAITGKLSDFVGLLVAPVLLATLCRTRSAGGFAWAHGAVALGFSAINLSPAAADLVVRVTAETPFPWAIVVDPTDLIALPMVALSYALFLPWIGAEVPAGRIIGRAGFGLGMLACVATSPPPEPLPEPLPPNPQQPQQPIPGQVIFPTERAALMITNETSVEQLVRLRPLRDGIEADCTYLTQAPSERIAREWFAPAALWSVEPGRAIPVVGRGTCTAYLVDGPELPMRMIFFRDNGFPNQTITTEGPAVPPGLRIAIQLPQGSADWGAHLALMAAPPRVREPVEPACQTVPEGFGVEWSTVPVGARLIGRMETAPDGCTAFDFEPQDERTPPVRWFACLPAADLPFEAGDQVTLTQLSIGAGGQQVQGVEVSGPGGRMLLARGRSVPDGIDVASVGVADSGCAPTYACGATVPVALQLNHPEGPATPVILGEPTAVGRGALIIARAERRTVLDRDCETAAATLNDIVIESLFIETF